MKAKFYFSVTASRTKFDERQNLVRGQTFFHTAALMFALLLANAFLADNGIFWASPFYTNVLIGMAAFCLCGLELALRGAYSPVTVREKVLFATKTDGARIVGPTVSVSTLLAVSVILLVIVAVEFAHGAALIENAALTDTGCGLAIGVMFLAVGATATIKQVTEGKRVMREIKDELERQTHS
ncbi:MAG: hypothetical protein LBN02_00545 [Oscillospiraceae bacterium]|jgi:hypothetical protein|nr:hypothetical protein [Oscillospiraceae bacterium]